VTEIDLNQHWQACPTFFSTEPIETLCEVDRIEGVNDVKQANCPSRFVGLKVSDEVPAHVLVPNLGDLPFCFLHAVLTEVCRPELTNLLDNSRRMGLADGDEPDVRWVAAAPLGSGGQPRANVCKSYCEWFLRQINLSHEIEFDTES
jgi:hypothetical protein